jgi:hypothetical protein
LIWKPEKEPVIEGGIAVDYKQVRQFTEVSDDLVSASQTRLTRVLLPGGRLVFSVYHPDLAQAGKEANFNISGIEYLGAIRYTVDDYLNLIDAAGLRHLRYYEFEGDPDLMLTIPEAENLIGKRVLLVIEARKAALSCRGTDSW